MRRSIVSVALIVFVLAMAVGANAWDRVYSGDTPMTHDAGSFGVGAGVVYFAWNGIYDDGGEKQDFEGDAAVTEMYIPVDIYYSILDQLEIGIQPLFVMNSMTDAGGDDYDATGIGDTWIDAKYMFMMEPMVAARVGGKIATGDDEGDEDNGPTGEGQMDIDGSILFGVPAGPGHFGGQVGYRMRMEDEGGCKPGDEIHFLVCYGFPMTDVLNLKIAADGYFGSDEEHDGEAQDKTGMQMVSVNPGVVYMMDNGMDVGFDIHYTIMGTNEASKWGAGLFVGWGTTP